MKNFIKKHWVDILVTLLFVALVIASVTIFSETPSPRTSRSTECQCDEYDEVCCIEQLEQQYASGDEVIELSPMAEAGDSNVLVMGY